MEIGAFSPLSTIKVDNLHEDGATLRRSLSSDVANEFSIVFLSHGIEY